MMSDQWPADSDLVELYESRAQQELSIFKSADEFVDAVRVAKNGTKTSQGVVGVPGKRYSLRLSSDIDGGIAGVEFLQHIKVYVDISSKVLTADELQGLTSVPLEASWSVGDKHPRGSRIMNFTKATIQSGLASDEGVAEMVDSLLDILESDIEGVINLFDKTKCVLRIVIWSHPDRVGGFGLDCKALARVSHLGLGLDLQRYVSA